MECVLFGAVHGAHSIVPEPIGETDLFGAEGRTSSASASPLTFGIIGGQGHESVQRAATRYVQTAERFATSAKPAPEFSYPPRGEVFYYLLTYDGVLRLRASESALEQGDDPSRPLFGAAQDVLSELWIVAEKKQP